MFCFLQRWKIDRALDEGDALTPRAEAHVTRCADCRRHHEQQRTIVNRLEQSAQLPVPEAPAFLRSRVMNALRDEESAPLPVRWSVAAWAPVAVVAAIAMVGILQTDPQPAPPAQPRPNPLVAKAPANLPPVALPSMNLQVALQKVPSQIAAPYDRELQNLQNDLKSAGQYLGNIVGYKLASSE